MSIKVLLVDDHKLFRNGLRQILEDTSDIVVVNEAPDVRTAVKILDDDGCCDVIILDINLQTLNGLELIKRLKVRKLNYKILVLSMYPENEYALRAIRLGANAYLTKDCSVDLLISVIRRIANGGKYVSQELIEKLLSDADSEQQEKPHLSLSNRELHIFKLICAGESLTAIGLKLSISIKTVSTYRTRILKKMGFKNNMQLFQYASENGLIE